MKNHKFEIELQCNAQVTSFLSFTDIYLYKIDRLGLEKLVLSNQYSKMDFEISCCFLAQNSKIKVGTTGYSKNQ
jgi:hypothetical protein